MKLNKKLLKNTSSIIKFLKNIKIETDCGYENFSGVQKSKIKQNIYRIYFNDETFIECTKDHIFFDKEKKEIKCVDICPGMTELFTKNGNKLVTDIKFTGLQEYVYDIIEIKNKNHRFYANGILTHNCQFQGSTITLIDADFILKELIGKEPILQPDEYTKMWDKPKKGRKYLIVIDTSGGVGSDYSVMNIFDITDYPEKPIVQVATYRRNTITPPAFGDIVLDSAKYWNNAYVIGEVNGLSKEPLNRLIESEYDNVYYDYDDESFGVYSDKASKPEAAMWFKEELESGKIILNDDATILEIGYFEELKPGVYRAKSGRNNHDDLVITCLWAIYFLKSKYFLDEREEWFKNDEDENSQDIRQQEETLNAFLEDQKSEIEDDNDNWLFNEENI